MAQQPSGTVLYERWRKDYWGSKPVPPEWKVYYIQRFELSFAGEVSLYRETSDPVMMTDRSGEGRTPSESAGGGEYLSDITIFSDREKETVAEEAEFLGKRFLISDSLRRLSWKISNETKTVAGHVCQKAVAARPELRRYRRRSYADTSTTYTHLDTVPIVAWFTAEIPANVGPDEFMGQLPGLILEMDIDNGKIFYKAVSIKTEVDKGKIKSPGKGKKMTAAEFAKYKDMTLKEIYLREERDFKRPGGKG